MTSFLLLVAYATGIVIGDNAAPFSFSSILVPLLLLLGWMYFRHQQKIALALLCSISLCLGIALYDLNRYPHSSKDHLLNFADKEAMIIDGRILTVMERSLSGYSLDVLCVRIVNKNKEVSVHGRLRLFVDAGENLWKPGDDIRFSSKLKIPRPFGTPGEFDLGRQLALNDIYVTAFVPTSDEILCLRTALPEQRNLIERGRTATARFISAQTTSIYGPLVKALAIGDKSGLAPEIRDLLARGGVSHLFAISGLHLALIALALHAVGLTLCRRSTRLLLAIPPARLLPILIAPLLILYLLWTGIGISTQRALLMVLAGALLFMFRRKTKAMNILVFSAMAILLVQPLALFTPSFQLSFAALAGILCGSNIWQPYIAGRSKTIQYLSKLFFSSLAATLATLPLVIYHFHLIAPSGIITNLFAIPVISWIGVPLALAGSICWPLYPQLAVIFFSGAETVIAATLKTVAAITTLPGLAGWIYYPSTVMIIGLSLLIIAIFLQSENIMLRRILIGVALLIFLSGMLPNKDLTITAFSVGQSESLLISFQNRHYLVDGGGLYGDRLDTGRQLVAPALGRLGIHQLDAVILTHSHPDHAKGLLSILSDIPCKRFVSGTPLKADDPLLAVIRNRKIPLDETPHGWKNYSIDDNAGLQLFIFRPAETTTADENDRSLAIYARYKTQGALLTGDLGENGMLSLIDNPPPGPVSLLKLPHHGSQNSKPIPLIDFLQPQLTFVSVGFQNRFGFPHHSVSDYLDRLKIPLFRTDQRGTLHFITDGEKWRVEQAKTGFFIDTDKSTLLQTSGLSTQERSRPK